VFPYLQVPADGGEQDLGVAALHAWRNRQMGLTVMGIQATDAPERASLMALKTTTRKCFHRK
jgi:hypothetical protein